MPYQSTPSLLRRWLAGLLALMIGLGPLATPAYAALTPLADEPLNIKNQAKPNIVLTVDDSTSMLYDFLPDYVASNKYCRDRSGAMNTPCGYSGSPINAGPGGQYVSPQYIWAQPRVPYPTYATGAGAVPASFSPALFTDSGPGAGCNLVTIPPTCSGGISPGALPGIATYPGTTPTSGSPLAGQPYEYWLLWPAPVHNSALNHMYYNPQLTYDPPAYPDATSYPQMDSGNTSNWTTVRADPFTTPASPSDCTTEPCVDLTANVIVGQWCNSDWTQGNDDSGSPFASNAGYCRTNGLVAVASAGSPAAIGDYMYPWTPKDITPNDFNSKVDMSTVSATAVPPTNATVKAAWAGAQDAKYFYENDNVLWCDISSPDWPNTSSNPQHQTCDMTGAVVPTCNGFRAGPGTCSATSTGNCNGYAAGTCNTGNGVCAGFTAGACNTANGVCAGAVAGACNTANGTCAGVVAGTCNTGSGNCNGGAGTCNTANGVCAGVVAGACNTTNGVCNGSNGACNTANGNCNGYTAGACAGGQTGVCGSVVSCAATHEACVAGTAATCGSKTPQTCVGGTQNTCNDVAQICNGALGAQTCANIVSIPPDPSTCTSAWSPTDCNLNPDPEGTCVYTTTCPPPTFAGKCSKQPTKVCTADADCPFIFGTCSTQTAKQCTTNTDCTGLKYCQSTTTVCSADTDCGKTGAKCNKTNAACNVDGDCALAGTCNYQTTGGVANGVCTANTDCKAFPNNCQVTTGTTGCTVGANSASCPLVPGSGTCTYASTTGGSCTTTADCGKVCQNAGKAGAACGSDAACNVSATCSAGKPNTTPCVIANDCTVNGACTTGINTGAACAANGINATCGAINKCSAGLPNTTTCAVNANCNIAGTCQTGVNLGAACTGSGTNASCGGIDKCTAGLPNTTTCTTAANCNTTGACTTGANTGAACTVNGVNAACGAVNKCTVGNVGTACTTAAPCNTAGTCTTGTSTGAACTGAGANAACGPIDKCSAGLPATTTCTTNANCNTTGACTTGVNTGAACAVNGVSATCGAINKCSAGQPATTSCTLAAQCNVVGACTTGVNTGTACNTNGVQAVCGAVNKCTAGKPSTTTCTLASQCTVNGSCTTGANTGVACAANGVNGTCGAVNKCTAGSIGTACTADATCTIGGTCTTGSVGTACTASGSTAQCALANGFCSNYPANTQACTVANVATQCAGSPGACSNDAAQACTVAGTCTTYGKCTISGNRCTTATQAADCLDQPGPANPLNIACDAKTAISAITLLADANGAGNACRRNNHTYASGPAVTASQTNYPSGKFTTPVVGEAVAGQGCSATARYASIPRHYWKTEVEWCDSSVSTANPPDKWLGYGDRSVGTCQDFKDVSHVFPRFYQFGATAGTDNYGTAAFARVDLTAASAPFTHTWVDDAGTTQVVTRTYAEEMTNYANWFAYYRTRVQAVKTVTSLAFLGKTGPTLNLDDSFRVGFHTLSNAADLGHNGLTDPAIFVPVDDFAATQKSAWATQLFGIKIPLGFETPNLSAMMRVGEYYHPGGSAELTGPDPIVLSCQKNWHMLFTDGFTNQAPITTVLVNDQDDTVPMALPVNGTAVAVTGLTPGAAWPAPFREDPAATASNSASDYAMNYWVTDLRPAMPQNVATSARDPASWPHQNFAAMSLGTEGKLPAGNQTTVETQLASGALQWPQPYPNVYKPDISGVDDLWHAAINGRGRFINAQSADELKLGMGQILQDVVNQAGSRAGAAFQSSSVSAANSYIYRTTFEPGWGASLSKVLINPTTGAEVSVAWEASAQLALQLTVVPGVKDTPWFTDRKVVTIDETSTAVPFLSGSIGPNELDSLAPGKTARAQAIVEFLRGNRTNEGTKTGQFRVRIGGLLGDIVNSQPVYVGKPNAPYLEANDPGYTVNFKNNAAFSGRPVRVYVGANDGMLHAFDDANGSEAWAFVPSDLFRPDDTGLGALSYQDGALPPFVHHYYVDATPRITDVNFGGGDTDWHTILVGGLGKGGKSYYALDVTQPSDILTEADAAKKVLWKFTDADLGYTYGRAIIAKTHAFSGQWLVIVPVGYNNASGLGKVFFLRASDGTLLKTMSTGSGTATSPSGLAQIAAYEKDYRNQIAEQIYAGDLDGNFWRFDISDPDDANWQAPSLMATFTSPDGKAQPVTTPPQIEVDIANGVDRWVFVGTGRLLDNTDLTTPAIADQIQTMYAIRDGTAATPITPWPATVAPRTDMVEVTDAVGLASKPDIGWYDDLPAGQRIVVPVQAALSLIAYIGTSPQTDPCLTGQPATVYARGYARGDSLLQDDTGHTVESVFEAEGGVSISLVALDGGSTDSGAGGFPDLRIAITAGTTGKVTYVKPKNPDFAQKHRMSWRLLGQ